MPEIGIQCEISKTKQQRWTLQENRLYITFLQQNMHFFQNYRTRMEKKVYVRLSKLLKTKTSIQVKSHHQKLIIKCRTIPNIIAFLQQELRAFGEEQSTSRLDLVACQKQKIQKPAQEKPNHSLASVEAEISNLQVKGHCSQQQNCGPYNNILRKEHTFSTQINPFMYSDSLSMLMKQFPQ